MTVLEYLRDKASSLPLRPGVYLMKDADGKIIYVGKSKKLKNRVSSYFIGAHNRKTTRMVSLVRDFDFIVCDTEIEALTLENTLIKKHSPKYNIKLKDAKSYPYIKITDEPYPHLIVTRDRRSGRGRYFGPYSGAAPAYAARDAVCRVFSLATCKRTFPRDIGKERPCLYAEMGRCVAPCTGKVGEEEYNALIRCAASVLDGNIRATKAALEAEMDEAAEALAFERAATLRDSIRALDALCEKQKVVADEKADHDVFALYTSETEGVLAMLSVRHGSLVNKNEFILQNGDAATPEDAMNLIVDYYDTAGQIPREILLDFDLEESDLSLLSDYLSAAAEKKVRVRKPERGDGRKLCDMALANAKEQAHQYRLAGEREDRDVRRLAELLSLPEVPRRVEAYDISNIGNEAIVASMVVYADGKLKHSDYRLFSIKSTDGADDYGSMREALTRRLGHIGDGTISLGEMPDLILLDGGATHVGVGKDVLSSLGLEIPLFGMVKDDFHKTRAMTDGENEISIAKEQNVYAFVYKLQEETHRFAVKSSQNQKTISLTHSSLEKIPGIGAAKAKKLLSQMPLSVIRTASAEELAALSGVSKTDAQNIAAYFAEKRNQKNQQKRK